MHLLGLLLPTAQVQPPQTSPSTPCVVCMLACALLALVHDMLCCVHACLRLTLHALQCQHVQSNSAGTAVAAPLPPLKPALTAAILVCCHCAGLEPHSALPTALPTAFGLAGDVLPEGLRHRTHGLASTIVGAMPGQRCRAANSAATSSSATVMSLRVSCQHWVAWVACIVGQPITCQSRYHAQAGTWPEPLFLSGIFIAAIAAVFQGAACASAVLVVGHTAHYAAQYAAPAAQEPLCGAGAWRGAGEQWGRR
jgi:hypothetical protein